jgi:hypothetical protein
LDSAQTVVQPGALVLTLLQRGEPKKWAAAIEHMRASELVSSLVAPSGLKVRFDETSYPTRPATTAAAAAAAAVEASAPAAPDFATLQLETVAGARPAFFRGATPAPSAPSTPRGARPAGPATPRGGAAGSS